MLSNEIFSLEAKIENNYDDGVWQTYRTFTSDDKIWKFEEYGSDAVVANENGKYCFKATYN